MLTNNYKLNQLVHHRHHDSLWIAAKTVLQQTSKFRIPIRYVGALSVDKGRDDIAKCWQGQVDLGSFFQPLTCGTGLRLPLRTLVKIKAINKDHKNTAKLLLCRHGSHSMLKLRLSSSCQKLGKMFCYYRFYNSYNVSPWNVLRLIYTTSQYLLKYWLKYYQFSISMLVTIKDSLTRTFEKITIRWCNCTWPSILVKGRPMRWTKIIAILVTLKISRKFQPTARSTRWSFPTLSLVFPSGPESLHSTVTVKMAWDLELWAFMFVAPTAPTRTTISFRSMLFSNEFNSTY